MQKVMVAAIPLRSGDWLWSRAMMGRLKRNLRPLTPTLMAGDLIAAVGPPGGRFVSEGTNHRGRPLWAFETRIKGRKQVRTRQGRVAG